MRNFGPFTGQKSAFLSNSNLQRGREEKISFSNRLGRKIFKNRYAVGLFKKEIILNSPNIYVCLASLALAQEGGDIQVLGVDAAGLEIVLNRLGLRLRLGLGLVNLAFSRN